MIARILLLTAFFPITPPVFADGVGATRIEASGMTFPALSDGEGPPVIFVHGLLADDRAWAGLAAPVVADGRRFIAYTQRGFGPGSSADEPFSRDRHVEDLVAILKVIDPPADLVAWSYGGAVALAAAAAAPDHVRRIVVYEPYVPELAPDADQSIGASMGATVAAMDAGDINEAAETAIEALFALGDGGFDSQPPAVKEFQRDNAPSFAAGWNADTPTAITCEKLGTIDAPLLIVTGATTLPGFAEMSKAVADCVPGARTTTLDGQGHGGPVFDRDAFSEAVLDFLDGP